jgi:hypothetical protein
LLPGCGFGGPAGRFRDDEPESSAREYRGSAAVRIKVTFRQVLDDGTEAGLDSELAAALEESAERFAGLAGWAGDESRYLDHAEREKALMEEGRELQRRLLQAAYRLDAGQEERAEGVTSAAGVRHGTLERGCRRGLETVFGPVTVTRMAYRNRREPSLHPADARQAFPSGPYSMGMRALSARHLASSGYQQARDDIAARTGVTIRPARLAGIAKDLARWAGDFYAERARDAEQDLPATDVIMMQGDGKGIAMRPEHRKNKGKEDGTRPGIKKMAEIFAVADFTPAVRGPARPPQGATRAEGPGQVGLGLGDREHRGQDRRRVRRGRPPRPGPGAAADLPR